MEENIEDVKTQEEVVEPEQQGVNKEVEETTQPEQTVEPVEVAPALESVTPVNDDVDEKGVPYKNRYMEEKRKREKELSELSEVKELLKAQVSQQQKPQYTEAQLKQFIAETDEQSHKLWAIDELEKIQEKKLGSVIENKFKSLEQKQKEEVIKQQSFNTVLQHNPDVYVKDASGNFAGWNVKSQLFQGINRYMNDPDVAKRPDALYVATRLAKADLYDARNPEVARKINEQTNQIKNLQKKTMIEGSGSQHSGKVTPAFNAALEKGKSGKVEDNVDAMKEVLRTIGVIDE